MFKFFKRENSKKENKENIKEDSKCHDKYEETKVQNPLHESKSKLGV